VQDNNADMVAKGRNTKPPINRMTGESNPNSKLTDRDIQKIEKLWRNGFSAASIAAEFGVSVSAIRKRMSGVPKRPAPKSIYEIIQEEKKNG
jgi:DNA-binding NarL/FixJ family response regulator